MKETTDPFTCDDHFMQFLTHLKAYCIDNKIADDPFHVADFACEVIEEIWGYISRIKKIELKIYDKREYEDSVQVYKKLLENKNHELNQNIHLQKAVQVLGKSWLATGKNNGDPVFGDPQYNRVKENDPRVPGSSNMARPIPSKEEEQEEDEDHEQLQQKQNSKSSKKSSSSSGSSSRPPFYWLKRRMYRHQQAMTLAEAEGASIQARRPFTCDAHLVELILHLKHYCEDKFISPDPGHCADFAIEMIDEIWGYYSTHTTAVLKGAERKEVEEEDGEDSVQVYKRFIANKNHEFNQNKHLRKAVLVLGKTWLATGKNGGDPVFGDPQFGREKEKDPRPIRKEDDMDFETKNKSESSASQKSVEEKTGVEKLFAVLILVAFCVLIQYVIASLKII